MDERKKREIYGGDEERETYMPYIIKLNQLKKLLGFIIRIIIQNLCLLHIQRRWTKVEI